MEQNFIINFANELYSDISNTRYPDNITNQLIDVSSSVYMFTQYVFRPNLFVPINRTINNSIIPSTSNNYYNNLNHPTSITLRDLLRTLYLNYYEEDESTSLESFINSTFDNKAKFKKVISDSELEKLKPQKFNKINETDTNIQCPILYYNFEENEEIIKLPCNHNYNCEAITKWLSQESNTCPVCRHEFDYKEINIDNKRQDTDQNLDQNLDHYLDQDTDQYVEEEQELSTQHLETTNIYNSFSSEDILMQQILLNSYSTNNH